jgi:hypothetical protein
MLRLRRWRNIQMIVKILELILFCQMETKAPFQQMTFTLADEQAEQIKNAINDIKQTDEYKYAETMETKIQMVMHFI